MRHKTEPNFNQLRLTLLAMCGADGDSCQKYIGVAVNDSQNGDLANAHISLLRAAWYAGVKAEQDLAKEEAKSTLTDKQKIRLTALKLDRDLKVGNAIREEID